MICLINCGTSFLKEIQTNLDNLNCLYNTIDIEVVPQHNFETYSGIIISGGPTMLTQIDYLKYVKPFDFIRTIKIPVLGIGLGHQILGLLYGSQINHGKLTKKMERIEIIKHDPLFANFKNKPLFKKEHSEHISLPTNFLLLAKSTSCKNEAMKHKSENIYGVQFHPEMSVVNGKQFFKNFLSLCQYDHE